jgi:glucokinase
VIESTAAQASGTDALAGDGYVGAVDLGGTKVLAAIVSPSGEIVSRAKRSTGKDGRPDPVLDRIAETVKKAAASAGVELSQLRAVGIGAPGPVDADAGVLHTAPNLDGWKDVRVADELSARLGVPVGLDNDVRVAVMAEQAAGAGRGARSWIAIWPGTGIGGGVVLDGQLWRGTTGAAGELGHITVKAGGPRCGCGAKGHLEALASRSAIVRYLDRRARKGHKTMLEELAGDVEKSKSGDIAEAFQKGDKETVRAIERAAKYLSIGIASVANTVNPELVVVGGGLTEALGEPFIRMIQKKLKGRPMTAATDSLRVVQSQLGDDAGITGAALVARRRAAVSPNGSPTHS